MQQMVFKQAIEPLEALISQAEAEIGQIEAARKNKKTELKRLRKSLVELTGSNGSKLKARKQERGPVVQEA